MVSPHTNSLLSEKKLSIFSFLQSHTKSYIIRQNPIDIDKTEHMFYNLSIETWCGFFWIGGVLVNEKEVYRERIIEMVKNCDNLHWLKVIYAYLKKLLE